ncbi:hypothetical protein KAU04_02630, partial [bacterium]|nr:hypothetical protein [bacterium]
MPDITLNNPDLDEPFGRSPHLYPLSSPLNLAKTKKSLTKVHRDSKIEDNPKVISAFDGQVFLVNLLREYTMASKTLSKRRFHSLIVAIFALLTIPL